MDMGQMFGRLRCRAQAIMTGHEVKLLGTIVSPYVLRARIALHLKGIKYDFLEEDLTNKSELLLKSNPVNKKVPVLLHNDKPVLESLIIVQYIDEAWSGCGPNIMPSSPYDRAVERFWAQFVDEKFFAPMFGIFQAKTGKEKKETTEKTIVSLQLLEDTFMKVSHGKKFFGGETIGFIDIALGSYLRWIETVEILCDVMIMDDSKIPHLAKWAEEFEEVDAVKDVLAETQVFVDYAKNLMGMQKALPVV